MRFSLIKLKPKSPFHIGERERWREGSRTTIPSDTIFSALCHCYLLLYGEIDSLLKGFIENNPPFLISSSFPYQKNNYFFPVPKNQISKEKEIKKIRFVELNGFKKLLSGEKLEDVINHTITIPSEEYKLWHAEDVPRIGLNRLTNHPGENFFHFGQVTYINDAGLFLLVDIRNEDIKNRLIASFNLLAQEGMGGDKTCGKGLFEKPEISELTINITSESDGICSLSSYYPLRNEIVDIDKGYYELEERKGYIYSPNGQSLRRRSIRVFTEGSVFSSSIKRFGSLVDVKPDIFIMHKVYRYGFMFSLPCKREVI